MDYPPMDSWQVWWPWCRRERLTPDGVVNYIEPDWLDVGPYDAVRWSAMGMQVRLATWPGGEKCVTKEVNP
jgi:hypothetical protein